MAKVIWTDPAISDLQAIAEYIALDKPAAAERVVKKVMTSVGRLDRFPRLGRIPPEIPDHPYRELIIPPCRVFYTITPGTIYIVFVMRAERSFDIANLVGRRHPG